MKKMALVALAALAGCQSMSGGIPSPGELERAVSVYSGAPIQYVLDRYGMPESQFMAGEIRVLVWNATTTVRHHEPVTTTTTGQIGQAGPFAWADAIPYRQTTTSRVGYDASYACQMQVGVLPDGTVDRVGFGGKMGACQSFMP